MAVAIKKTLSSYDPFHHFNFLADADGPLWEPYTSRQGSSCHVYTSSWLGHFLFWVYIAWYSFLDMYPPQWYPDGPFLSTRTWKLSSSCSRYRFVVFFSLHPSLTLPSEPHPRKRPMEVVLSLNTFQATGSAKVVRRSAVCGTSDVYLHMSQCKRVTMSCDSPLVSLRGRLI
jgi:hypothetical protein